VAKEVPVSESRTYVRADEHGVLRVGDSRVMLDSVLAGFHQGHSPETIQQQYPALSLAEVYGAIAYYLEHREEVNAYLRHQDAVWEEWLARSQVSSGRVVERLRALRRAQEPKAS
jgi:uncharacterized protein (DUF433 family)